MDAAELLARLAVFPAGRAIDADLRTTVIADLRKPENAFAYPAINGPDVAGLYLDLNGDGVDEFVLLTVSGGYVYENHDGQWRRVGRLHVTGPISSWQALLSGLTIGDVSAREPQCGRNFGLGRAASESTACNSRPRCAPSSPCCWAFLLPTCRQVRNPLDGALY